MDDDVLLSFPGSADYLRLARLAASDTAARARLPVDEVEDLRIAVDELCHALSEGDGSRRIELRMRTDPSGVEVTGTCPHPGGEFALSDLAATIVGAVVDELEVGAEGDARTFRIRKSTGDR